MTCPPKNERSGNGNGADGGAIGGHHSPQASFSRAGRGPRPPAEGHPARSRYRIAPPGHAVRMPLPQARAPLSEALTDNLATRSALTARTLERAEGSTAVPGALTDDD